MSARSCDAGGVKTDGRSTVDLIVDLYALVKELEDRYAHHGRHFTPDGHLVGSLGEALAADLFGLTLMDASNHGFDAVQGDKRIEIKATQRGQIALQADCVDLPLEAQPTHLIALKIHVEKLGHGEWVEVVYNGPAMPVWGAARKASKNGQQVITLTKLRGMDAAVPDEDRIVLA